MFNGFDVILIALSERFKSLSQNFISLEEAKRIITSLRDDPALPHLCDNACGIKAEYMQSRMIAEGIPAFDKRMKAARLLKHTIKDNGVELSAANERQKIHPSLIIYNPHLSTHLSRNKALKHALQRWRVWINRDLRFLRPAPIFGENLCRK